MNVLKRDIDSIASSEVGAHERRPALLETLPYIEKFIVVVARDEPSNSEENFIVTSRFDGIAREPNSPTLAAIPELNFVFSFFLRYAVFLKT